MKTSDYEENHVNGATGAEGTGPGQSGLPIQRAIGPIMLLTSIFFFNFLCRQMVGPFLPAIEEELGISHARSGLFVLFMGVGTSLSQLSVPYMAGARGYRFCILAAMAGGAIAMLFLGMLSSPWQLCLGFFAVGFLGGLYVPSGIAYLTVLIRPQDWGKAMGIHEIAPNLGLICGPFFASAAISIWSWRLGYIAMAGVMVVLIIIYGFKGRDVEMKPSPPSFSLIMETAKDPSFWVVGLLLGIAVGIETGVYAMLPLFLVNERGFELDSANHLLGMSRVPGLFMVVFSGWITDRLTARVTILLALSLSGVTLLFLSLGPTGILVPSIFFQAAAAGCLFPPILSAASGISTTQTRAITISLSLAIAPVLGLGLVPAGIGLAGDLGSFSTGLAAAALLTVAGIPLVNCMKKTAGQQISES